jgi:hypothetical protein
MAFFARSTQPAFMDILLFMARVAIRFRIFELGRQMTFLAFGKLMLAGQGEARQQMIELGLLPGFLHVASFTLLALLRFMLVIFLVT